MSYSIWGTITPLFEYVVGVASVHRLFTRSIKIDGSAKKSEWFISTCNIWGSILYGVGIDFL